jgi:pimeloyl-ACP methyl ester carboxylesterase
MTRDLVPGGVRRDVAVDGMRFSLWRSDPGPQAVHPASVAPAKNSPPGASAPPAAMLLHGVPETGAMWRDLLAELGSDRVVLAPDLPGLGSSELRGPYDARTVAARIAALALHEVDAPVDIVGHDWGGVVGLTLAASRPDLVRRLVVLNAAYRHVDLRAAWHIPTASLPGLPELAFRVGGRSLVGQVIRVGWHADRPVAPDLLAHYQDAYADPQRIAAMLGYYRDNFRPRAAAALRRGARRARPSPAAVDAGARRRSPRTRMPSLVVWGALDPVLPDTVRASVVRDLGDCRCVIIPDAGHFVVEEAAETVIPAVAAFLREPDGLGEPDGEVTGS